MLEFREAVGHCELQIHFLPDGDRRQERIELRTEAEHDDGAGRPHAIDCLRNDAFLAHGLDDDIRYPAEHVDRRLRQAVGLLRQHEGGGPVPQCQPLAAVATVDVAMRFLARIPEPIPGLYGRTFEQVRAPCPRGETLRVIVARGEGGSPDPFFVPGLGGGFA